MKQKIEVRTDFCSWNYVDRFHHDTKAQRRLKPSKFKKQLASVPSNPLGIAIQKEGYERLERKENNGRETYILLPRRGIRSCSTAASGRPLAASSSSVTRNPERVAKGKTRWYTSVRVLQEVMRKRNEMTAHLAGHRDELVIG
jgi:hypothetical protein